MSAATLLRFFSSASNDRFARAEATVAMKMDEATATGSIGEPIAGRKNPGSIQKRFLMLQIKNSVKKKEVTDGEDKHGVPLV